MRWIVAFFLIAAVSPVAQGKEKVAEKSAEKTADKSTEKSSEKSDDEEISEILDSMGYPELQVVPRASERLKMEAKSEASTWWAMHWPVEISGLTTLYVGTSAKGNQRDGLTEKEKKDATTVSSLSTAVGAAWLIGGVVLGAQRPYGNGAKSIAKLNPKDERQALMRERLAEEALERPAKTMRILQNLAVFTNFALNAANIHYSNEKGMITAGVGAIIAFLPYMFEDPTIAVHDKHIEYKKKIYAPLKSASLHIDSTSGAVTPMTNLVWQF